MQQKVQKSNSTIFPRRDSRSRDLPPVFNQLTLNSCSANAIAAALWFDLLRSGRTGGPPPSRLFIYYNERARQGLKNSNAPVSLRDGYRAVDVHGVCPEPMWPYDPRRYAKTPPGACYRSGWYHKTQRYRRLPRELRVLRACLAEGFPVTFGLSVHKSMMSAAVRKSGMIPLPVRGDRVVGGHAMLIVGYDDPQRHFIVRNSWGSGWGLAGYALLPYRYVLETPLAWDFWTCRSVDRPGRWKGRRGE